MERLPDDIGRYIRLTENAPVDPCESTPESSLPGSGFLEDLRDIIFRLTSYCEQDGSQEYAQGVEDGLALAGRMLTRLADQYSGDLGSDLPDDPMDAGE